MAGPCDVAVLSHRDASPSAAHYLESRSDIGVDVQPMPDTVIRFYRQWQALIEASNPLADEAALLTRGRVDRRY